MFVTSVTGEVRTSMTTEHAWIACCRLIWHMMLYLGTRQMRKLLVIMSRWTLALYLGQALVIALGKKNRPALDRPLRWRKHSAHLGY